MFPCLKKIGIWIFFPVCPNIFQSQKYFGKHEQFLKILAHILNMWTIIVFETEHILKFSKKFWKLWFFFKNMYNFLTLWTFFENTSKISNSKQFLKIVNISWKRDFKKMNIFVKAEHLFKNWNLFWKYEHFLIFWALRKEKNAFFGKPSEHFWNIKRKNQIKTRPLYVLVYGPAQWVAPVRFVSYLTESQVLKKKIDGKRVK